MRCFGHCKVYQWNTSDLDHISTKDNHKSMGTLDLFLADEFLRSVVLSNYNILGDFLKLKTEIAHLRTGDIFLQRIVPSSHEEVMFLFMGGFTTTLMKKHYHFYLLDPQSRDE